MINLENKNILIIMPKFYSYQSKMREDLESRGAHPFFYDEEPEKTKFLILKNIGDIFHNEKIFDGFNKKLRNKIFSEMPDGGYDYLLVIRGNVLSEQTIHELKNKALKSTGKSIYYSWDSFENMRHKGEIGKLFDWRGTFDSVDAKESKLDYELVPLFYSDEFDAQRLPLSGGERGPGDLCSEPTGAAAEKKLSAELTDEGIYDYVSVSAFFPFRYRYFKAFKKANPDKKMCLKLYLAPSVYRGKKLKDPKLVKDLDMDIISFEPFKPEEIREMCRNSKAILDLAHEQQQGLTMRTMETLGIKRKLVTNNIYLRDYEFYNDSNDLILTDLAQKADEAERTGDYSAFVLPGSEWLDKPYVENEEIRIKYSIHSWIDKLFN